MPPFSRTPLLRQKIPARLSTPPAGLRADRTVFHHLRVLPAFLGAVLAGSDARPEEIAHELLVRRGNPRDDLGRGEADICTIHVLADAGDLMGDVVLGETGIRARVARLMAGIARCDAFHRFRVIG